jgi:hypothetical protein
VLGEQPRDAEQDLATLRGRQPRPVGEGALRGSDGGVDVGGAGGRESPMTSSWSAGLTLVKVLPEAAGFQSPPIRFRAVVDTSDSLSRDVCWLGSGRRLYARSGALQIPGRGRTFAPVGVRPRDETMTSQLKNRRSGILFVT